MIKRPGKTRIEPSRKSPQEDMALWHKAIYGVTPLKKSNLSIPSEKKFKKDLVPNLSRSQNFLKINSTVTQPPAAFLSHGTLVGLDRRTGERLRRGKLPIEGYLDMHGMTQSEAYNALDNFVLDSQAAGKRCVLVITGKGNRGSKKGVLKEAVPQWLNEPSLRARVLAFDFATPRLGGTGALCILLRRTRL